MKFKKVITYGMIVIAAVVASFSYAILVFPNSFAPSGINGLCTIIQHVFGINIGYLSVLINVPLAILTYVKVSKSLAVRSMVFVGVFSGMLILLEQLDLSAVEYYTENGTSRILGPLIAGILSGCIYSLLIRLGTYTGGTDFISAVIHSKHPQKSVFMISFVLNSLVALLSFIVYGYNIEPVFLSILYSFASTTIADRTMRAGRSATRFIIVTRHGREIADDIIRVLHHTSTIIDSEGAFSHNETSTLICVVNNGQSGLMLDILRKYPDTFATTDPVSEVYGTFRKLDKNGNENRELFDHGDI